MLIFTENIVQVLYDFKCKIYILDLRINVGLNLIKICPPYNSSNTISCKLNHHYVITEAAFST